MSSSLGNKISDLQARLKAENELLKSDSGPVETNPFGGSRPGSGRRPKLLPVDGTLTPTRTRKHLDLPGSIYPQPVSNVPDTSLLQQKKELLKMTGILNIDGVKFKSDIEDLELIGELGNGTCGHVVKMLHKPSQRVIAVKQMRRSGNAEENKRIAMDLEVVLVSHDCDYIVHCLGCFVTDSDVWICMELMGSCFDKLIKFHVNLVPEPILGKVTLATVKALHYLKENHGVMHRDVKPSNILIDERGNVKLCDFGISGRLVDSKAKSMNAGCAAYMSPERINPADPKKPDYDIRADVWSLGITLVELATGCFPYPDCKSDFEVLSRVMQDDPPSLPNNGQFSQEFINFVQLCLVKDYRQRPKYKKLLEHPFIKRYETEEVDMASWYACAVVKQQNQTSRSKLESKGTKCFCGFNHDNRSSAPKERSNTSTSKHKTTQDWEKLKGVWTNILKSPLFNRRKKGGEKEAKANNKEEEPSRPPVSPLLLQRFLHQQIQHFNAVRPFRSPSLSPKYSPDNKTEAFRYDEGWLGERERRGASMSPPLQPRQADQFGRHSSRNYRVSPSPTWLVRSKSMADRSDTSLQRSSEDIEHMFYPRMDEQYPGILNDTQANWRHGVPRPHGQMNLTRENSFNWRTEEHDLRMEDHTDRRAECQTNLWPDDRNFYDPLICRMDEQNNESHLNNRLDGHISSQTGDNLSRRIKDYLNSKTGTPFKEKKEVQSNHRVDDLYNMRRQETPEDKVNQRLIDLFNMRLTDNSKPRTEDQLDQSRSNRRPLSPSASTSPEPPPRINKRVSPLLARRIAYNNSRMARLQQSPSMPRRYNLSYQHSMDPNSTSTLRSSSLPCSPILSSRNYTYDVRNYLPHHDFIS